MILAATYAITAGFTTPRRGHFEPSLRGQIRLTKSVRRPAEIAIVQHLVLDGPSNRLPKRALRVQSSSKSTGLPRRAETALPIS